MVQEIFDLRREIASLCGALGVERLYLFGSAAQVSTLAEVRDLDFLVQFKTMPPVEYAQNYFLLIERLEELFHSPIDLVEIEVIDNPYFKEAVEESKVPLYGTP
jgi:predicted nucleotidyltransferase